MTTAAAFSIALFTQAIQGLALPSKKKPLFCLVDLFPGEHLF